MGEREFSGDNNISDLKQSRLEKLRTLQDIGVDPYTRGYAPTHTAKAVKDAYEEGMDVACAGRITAMRAHGKVIFFDIRDESARLQCYVNQKQFAKKDLIGLLDIGDFVWVKGELFKTRTEEITINAQDIVLLTKSLLPLPEKWHGLKDQEKRFRQRYLDLIANPDVKEVFYKRAKIVSTMRKFLDERGYLEVETPMLHPIPGGAAGRPFKTRHNTYDIDLYLRIAPELYLKKLLVGGFEKVYELNRSFRNEGVSTRHNPEFTMIEIYTAYMDYKGVMKLCEELLYEVAVQTLGSPVVEYDGKKIDFTPPWHIVSFAELVKGRFDINPEDSKEEIVAKLPKKAVADVDVKKLSRSQIVKLVEDMLDIASVDKPVFVTDYFSILCPLSCVKKDNPNIAERFELFIGGMEVANAYSELNDPIDQKKRLLDEVKANGLDESMLDMDFVTALEYGMPPAGGLGIGVDRIAMLMSGRPSIREVILFPLLRPRDE